MEFQQVIVPLAAYYYQEKGPLFENHDLTKLVQFFDQPVLVRFGN